MNVVQHYILYWTEDPGNFYFSIFLACKIATSTCQFSFLYI